MSLLFWVFLEVVVKLFDYFWKPNISLSKSCVNCLLRIYFVYCKHCVSNDVNGACWCTCSLVGLRVPDMCFWPAKTRKKLEHFEMNKGLWPGAQIWFRHKGRKLVTAPLSFPRIDGYSCLRYWNDKFFQLCSKYRIEFFSFCPLTQTFEIGFQKWFDHDWIILGVFVGLCLASSTSYLRGLNSAWIAQLLFLFWRLYTFSLVSSSGNLAVLSKCLYFLIIGFCNTKY